MVLIVWLLGLPDPKLKEHIFKNCTDEKSLFILHEYALSQKLIIVSIISFIEALQLLRLGIENEVASIHSGQYRAHF